MRKATYKKVDERIEHITIHHEESVDEQGNVIEAYDEVIEKVVPIMDVVYEEMTQEEIDSLPKYEEVVMDQSQEDKITKMEQEINELKEIIKNLTR